MDKKQIVEILNTTAHDTSKDFSHDEKVALSEAIKIVKHGKNKEQFLQVVEILIKLLGIGSNFFDK